MSISLANLIIIALIVLILFGAGKLPKVMGDLGKGIKNFRDSIKNNKDQVSLPENDSGENKKN